MVSVHPRSLPMVFAAATALLFACQGGGDEAPRSPQAVEMEAASGDIPLGREVRLPLTAQMSDGSSYRANAEATWSSADPAILSPVEGAAAGTFRAVGEGETELRATWKGFTATQRVRVGAAVIDELWVEVADAKLPCGVTAQLTALGRYSNDEVRDVTADGAWSSSHPQIATLTGPGELRAEVEGQSTVEVLFAGRAARLDVEVIAAALLRVELDPPARDLATGTSAQFTVTGIYSDGTKVDLSEEAEWSSSAPLIAEVNGSIVRALAPGSASVTAAARSMQAQATLSVRAAEVTQVSISPATVQLKRMATMQLTATGVFSDSTTVDVTRQVAWTSSAPSIASVSAAGELTGHADGTALISASFQGKTPTVSVTVSGIALSGISIHANSSSVPKGYSLQLTATGHYADGTEQDVTQQVVWASSAPSVAAVSNATGSHGLVTALDPGSAVMTATLGSTSASFTMTVAPAALEHIAITPESASAPKGMTFQLTATGYYSDNTTEDLTKLVSWSTSSPTVAYISSASGAEGAVHALAEGTAVITATWGQQSTSVFFTVLPPVLTSISLTPAQQSVAAGSSYQLSAWGTWSDGTQSDVTEQVTWSSRDQAVATVSDVSGTRGMVTGVAAGSTHILADGDGVRGVAEVTVY